MGDPVFIEHIAGASLYLSRNGRSVKEKELGQGFHKGG